ncbi:DUF86 domain-containing protein [Desertibacillus haloalkaliphilus]|uniref:DUF86 domain-containing protein n=1 Tax=Desertibacillus haloalkaliphilus TaxID=1328930 RepID=UPI001C256853|nr:DUF86 domain-containing protein [Desertibacillus haloalkaliphilus]MBU8906568.1 DUF86 domain-containing protein [Desertibacillus haloalkaliphilus]
MYFVDREKIEQTLTYMQECLNVFADQQSWHTTIEKLAVERIAHVVIESIIDTGNSMIDGFIMRDPGSYEDIVDILEDEKVVTTEMAVSLKKVIAYRKQLVQDYTDINHNELADALTTEGTHLNAFPTAVRDYLTNELGPVSAFLPNEK